MSEPQRVQLERSHGSEPLGLGKPEFELGGFGGFRWREMYGV